MERERGQGGGGSMCSDIVMNKVLVTAFIKVVCGLSVCLQRPKLLFSLFLEHCQDFHK